MTPEQRAAHIAAFDAIGEAAVRSKLERNIYAFGTPVHGLVLQWLHDKEVGRHNELRDPAERSAVAAEESAKAARGSERVAWIAIGISLFSIVITIILWYYAVYAVK